MRPASVPLYCFSCGAPLSGEPQGLVPMCPACVAAGPQLPPEQVRWTFRTAEGRTQGPLSREAFEDQYARGLIGPDDRVARQGGAWSLLPAHRDFQRYFVPGSPDAQRLGVARQRKGRSRRSQARRSRARLPLAVAFTGVVAALVYVGVTTNLLVLPEARVRSIQHTWTGLHDGVMGVVSNAADEDAAAQALRASRTLPAPQLIEQLAAAHPDIQGSAAIHLARGRVALWQGTAAGLRQARVELEQALVLAPEDPETNAALAEAYANLLAADPSLAPALSNCIDRAALLAPDAPSTLRARATAALASGDTEGAASLGERCGLPLSRADADVGCALVVAAARQDADLIEALDKRTAGAYPVRLRAAQMALQQQRYARALTLAGDLARRDRTEPGPQLILLQARVALGAWDDAISAAERVAKAQPQQLEARRLGAEVQLKARGRPDLALLELDAIIADPGFAAFAQAPRVQIDAATAALLLGDADSALAHADAALALVADDPTASLRKAAALQQLGQTTQAEDALRAANVTDLSGMDAARWQVQAARLWSTLGRDRHAITALDAALTAAPGWPLARLESARLRLLMKNVDGAVEQLQTVPLLDASDGRSPLHATWVPPMDWQDLNQRIVDQLDGDVRHGNRVPELLAVVAWATGQPDAPEALQAAVSRDPTAWLAGAALAQVLQARDDVQGALALSDQVIQETRRAGLHQAIKGWALARLGQTEASEAAFNLAVQDAAETPAVYRLHGLAREAVDDTDGARAAWAEALRLAPDDVIAQAAMARLDRQSQ